MSRSNTRRKLKAWTRRTPALDRLSLFIPAHRTTALVGPSGAGKSTLVDLLPRLREPSRARYCSTACRSENFDQRQFRRAISFAPQTPQIFNVTIAEHIRYGWPEASMDDMRIAARLAQAADFIEALPDGYETMLGRGRRSFFGRPTSADRSCARGRAPRADPGPRRADRQSRCRTPKAMFREALEKVRRETDITIIIIGHRLSTVMSADHIVVLNAGRVAESGTHGELMAQRRLVRSRLRAAAWPRGRSCGVADLKPGNY